MSSDNPDLPCLGIRGFIQRSTLRNWPVHPETVAAQKICRTRCPAGQFRTCAEAALRAGEIFGETDRPRVADGVVMAGVVCRGDAATARALRRILSAHAEDPNAADRRCADCQRPMCTRRRRKPGHVLHGSGGRCYGCYRASGRAA